MRGAGGGRAQRSSLNLSPGDRAQAAKTKGVDVEESEEVRSAEVALS